MLHVQGFLRCPCCFNSIALAAIGHMSSYIGAFEPHFFDSKKLKEESKEICIRNSFGKVSSWLILKITHI